MEDLRVADVYVAQTLPYWRQQARCIRACSAVEEVVQHIEEYIVQKGVVRVVMVKRWSVWFH